MKYRDLDVLVCPDCKNFPLKVWVIEKERGAGKTFAGRCEKYCAFYGLSNNLAEIDISTCKECQTYEINVGLLLCEECKRWYPILEGIPILFKAVQRNIKVEREFLRKYGDKLPKEVKVEE